MKKYFDESEIRKAIDVLGKDLFEVRIIKGRKIYSGYFDNADTLIEGLKKQDLAGTNVYVTLQELHPGCRGRIQFGRFLLCGDFPTTSDRDIIGYRFLPVDLDPVRPAGISSNEKELQAAEELSGYIVSFMKAIGYHDHIKAFSGNGYHLLYPIKNMTADEVHEILDVLDSNFSNALVHVDTTNYNPARVFKLYGTLAQKGLDTPDRPHRMSKILEVHHEDR